MLLRSIFEPYEEALLDATTDIAVPLALALLSEQSRDTGVLLETVKARLSASEADRAARLGVIHTLQTQLEASDADRAVRLGVIHTLQAQLEASEADLDGIRTQLGQARLRVDAMELSRSWRWTWLVRWAAGWLGKRSG